MEVSSNDNKRSNKRSMTKSQPQESQSVNTPPWAWTKAVNNILSNPPFDEPDEIPVLVSSRNWLYLSDEHNSIRQIDKMLLQGVTHVLSMNIRPGQWQTTIEERLAKRNIAHKSIAAKDNEDYDLIGKHWESEAKPFLLEAKNHPNGKIVVHCAAGTNRSGLIVAAAMLLLDDDDDDHTGSSTGQDQDDDEVRIPNKKILLDVVKDLKRKRGMVLTNLSFQQQLCILAALHDRLGDKPTGYSDEPPAAGLKQHRQAGNFESMFQ